MTQPELRRIRLGRAGLRQASLAPGPRELRGNDPHRVAGGCGARRGRPRWEARRGDRESRCGDVAGRRSRPGAGATGQPIARTTLADPAGYGLGVTQQTSSLTGTIWVYEGETFGYRVLHLYFPRSGMIIALAVNSATGNDDINDLAGSVYQTLQKGGAVHTG